MGFRSDDLTDLFTAGPSGPAQPMAYRQGIITEWNPVTLENTVLVGGATFSDLPVLGVAEAASYAPGVAVGIVTVGSTWAILGRFVIPNTADATDAITQVAQRSQTASVATAQDTTSSSYTDLATAGPSVTNFVVPASGKVNVTISALIAGLQPIPFGAVGVEVSGATSVSPSADKSLLVTSASLNGSKVILLEGLTPGGVHTFMLKYRSDGGQCFFSNRDIIVEGL